MFVNNVFGVFAVIFIGDSPAYTDPKYDYATIGYAQTYFQGLDDSMFTLLQVITGDTWASMVARPVMEVRPHMQGFFILFVGVAMRVLLSQVTAVIVDNALSTSAQDADQRLVAMDNEREAQI